MPNQHPPIQLACCVMGSGTLVCAAVAYCADARDGGAHPPTTKSARCRCPSIAGASGVVVVVGVTAALRSGGGIARVAHVG